MRLNGLLSLGLGLVLAGGSVAYTHQAMQVQPVEIKTETVVVAKVDIPFGVAIDDTMLDLLAWPSDVLPEGAHVDLNNLLPASEGEPRRAKHAIAAGEVILASKVSAFGERVTMTEMIDPSKRAVAIRVNDVTGVAGFVAPSDRVDVVMTRRIENTLRASTILQGIRVLAIDQTIDKVHEKASVVTTVTVEVEPSEVQKVALAQQAGTLSLSLRNLAMVGKTTLDDITSNDLSSDPQKEVVLQKIPSNTLPTVSVNRAGERSRVQVPNS